MKLIDILAQLKRKTKKSQIVKRSRIVSREFRPIAGFFAFFTKIISQRKSLLHNSVQRINRRQVKAVVHQSHLRAHQTVSASRSKIFAAYRQSFTAAKNLFQQTNIRAKSFWQNKSLVLTLPSIRFYTTQREIHVPTIVHQSVHRRVKNKPVSIWRYPKPWLVQLSDLKIAYFRWLGWTARRIAPLGMATVYVAVIISMLISGIYPRGIAYAGSTAFDFSTPENYSLSDSTQAEVTSNQARLKSLQYTGAEANTAALYHFDETTGNTADDSSTNSNDVAVGTTSPSAGGDWEAGKVTDPAIDRTAYGSALFNNASSFTTASAADSASLSLTSNMTIEAYIKFPSAFDKTANMSQAILDKGNYKLYFDESDGKLKYELDDNGTKEWTKKGGADGTIGTDVQTKDGISGSWRQVTPMGVYSMAIYNSTLYVGTGGALGGMAEVWRYDSATCATCWTKVGGDAIGGSWDALNYEMVMSMAVFSNRLYVGLGYTAGDAEVYQYDPSRGTPWDKVGGDGTNNSWTSANNIEGVYSMVADASFLYVGTGLSAGDADVWRFNGTNWGSNIGANYYLNAIGGTYNNGTTNINSSWGASGNVFDRVWSMVFVGTTLYIGLGDTAGEAEVWGCASCSTAAPVTWGGARIGGRTTNGSWADAKYEWVASMATDGTNLYAGLGGTGTLNANQATCRAGTDGEVWKYWDHDENSGTPFQWTQIGGDSVDSWDCNASVAYETVRGLTYVDTSIYASLGDSAGDGEVYRYSGSGTTWTRVGGDGANTSWDAAWTAGGAGTTNSKDQVFLGANGTNLVALTMSATNGRAEVWSCASCSTSPTWSWIGGRDFKSWGSMQLAQVQDYAMNDGKLYVGLGSNAAGTPKQATVFEFDGTTWTQIGGGNLNLSSGGWEYYENVRSMVSYKGEVYVGMGDTAQDADVWKWNGTTWTQIGGDGLNNGWTAANNIEEVSAMAADNTYLYAGVGNSASDADIWRWDGTNWGSNTGASYYLNAIGGTRNDNNSNLNSSWGAVTVFDRINRIAIYNGLVYVALGSTGTLNATPATCRANTDSEIWRWNGSTWTRIAGDGVNSSWDCSATIALESVRSLAFVGTTLYAGLGDTNDAVNSGDADVWSCSNCTDVNATPVWTQIGGDDATGVSLNSSWDAKVYEQVLSLAGYNGELYAGLGNTAGDAEIWKWDGVAWSQVGGDSVGSSFSVNYENVQTLGMYQGRLLAGLGASIGGNSQSDAEVWSLGGTEHIISSTTASWTANVWTHVAATYDGTSAKIYVNGVQDGDTVNFTKTLADGSLPLTVGGLKNPKTHNLPAVGFSGYIDELRISNTARAPNTFVLNQYATTAKTVQPATAISRAQKHSWATFDATDTVNGGTVTYRLSNDGSTWKYWSGANWITSSSLTEANTEAVVNTRIPQLPMTDSGLKWQAILSGDGDQRVILNSVTVGYVDDTTDPSNPLRASFTGNDGSWYNRANPVFSWSAATDPLPDPNPSSEQASGVEGYYVYFGTDPDAIPREDGVFQTGTTFTAPAIGSSDTSRYYLLIQTEDYAGNITDDVTGILDVFNDTQTPDNVASVTAKSASGGSLITTNTWYGHAAPEFSWTAPDDHVPDPNTNSEIASGVKGYYIYFGSTATAIPREVGTFQTGTTFVPSTMTSGVTYYLRIQTRDKALNTTSDGAVYDAFTYKYDGSGPTPPSTISVSPSGFTAVNSYTFIWPITGASGPSDPGAPAAGSGLKGYQYKTSATTGALSEWSTLVTDGSGEITIPTAADKEGANTFYLRYVDVTDNYSASATVTFYYAGSAPGAPLNLQVSPTTTVDTPQLNNSFSFSWDTPAFFNGSIKQYHFSVNKLPTSTNTTSTPFRTLAAAAYATQQGKNTLYVVAEDEAGNKNFNIYASIDFYTSTPAPAPPTALQIFDISNRDTQEYAISMKWTEPTKASGFDGYEVFRSADNVTFTSAGTTKSPVFIDTNLESKTYYFKVKSKDNAGQSSADSTTVNLIPTGRYTSPPTILAAPTIVTKSYSAAIDWDTDRTGSSFVEYGPAADKLGKEKGGDTIGTLDLVTRHVVDLKGLEPETTYYYQAVWVDQDGNRGQSDVLAFKTGLRPKISDVTISNITLTSATINWVSTTVSTSTINYGLTKSFGQIVSDTSGGGTTKHSMQLTDLKDTSNYYFVITGKDLDDNTLSSDDYSFTTLTRPIISDFKFETVKDAPTTSIKFTWNTNVPTTSIVTVTKAGTAPKSQSNSEYATAHEIIIKDLADLTPYSLQAKGVDNYGNNALSETANFTTPDDSRPPKVVNMTVEVRSSGVGATQKAQLIINWETDEPGTSQIEYGPGISSDNYPSKSQEDSALSTTHVVIVPELEPAKLYHFRAVSRDRANNAGTSDDTTSITGKVQRSVVDIIMASLQRSLGFLSAIPGLGSK